MPAQARSSSMHARLVPLILIICATAVPIGMASLTAAGSMATSRSGAVGIPLADGRALVVGGWDGAGAVATAEIYNPATGLFSPVDSSMSAGRVAASAISLANGDVLILSGHDGAAPIATAELYHPDTGTFTPTSSPTLARLTSAVLLSDGRALMAGGTSADGTSTNLAELYDPALDTFAPTGNLQVARHGHAMTRLADGRVLITGGWDDTGTLVVNAELYNPGDGAFYPASAMLTARADHGAVLLPSGNVLSFGGRDVTGTLASAEIYDPTTDTFAAVPGLAEPRSAPAVAAFSDGRILVAGGYGMDGIPLATAEVFELIPPQPTTTALGATPNPSVYGQTVRYTATVTGLVGAPDGDVRFLDGGTLLGSAPLDAAGCAMLETTLTPAGIRSITAVYDGSERFERSRSAEHSQSVSKASTTSSFTVSPVGRQYSDRMTFEATISGAEGEQPAEGAIFKIGTKEMTDEPVPFKKSGTGTWKATLPNHPLLETSPAGQLKPTGATKLASVRFTGISDNYAVSHPGGKSVLIYKEDARVQYDGPRTVMTASRTSGAATIPLKVTVRDIAVTADHNGDKDAGDVRLATVSFMNRATGAIIATVNVTLPDENDTTTGVASYDWNVDIGSSQSKGFTVGFVVGTYYTRNHYADNVLITVSKK